jgi:hypothetical protein
MAEWLEKSRADWKVVKWGKWMAEKMVVNLGNDLEYYLVALMVAMWVL